ncbi:hypothetical protein ACI65C_013564 [Semiaphis heraclei]
MASCNKKSNTYCSVYGCSTYYNSGSDISFHSLPKENSNKIKWINKNGTSQMIDRRKAWILKLHMDTVNLKKTQIKICSKHFVKEDFILPDYKVARARLTQEAVPSQNLPKLSIKSKSPLKRKSPKKRFLSPSADEVEVAKTCDLDLAIHPLHLHQESNLTEKSNSVDIIYLEDNVISQEIATQLVTVTSADAQVQVTIGDIFVPFVSLIDTSNKLNTLTGIPTFEILDHIIYLYSKEYPATRCHRLSIKERLILVFIKLKQDLSFAVLAILFKAVSGETCRALYNSFIPLLANILRPLIYWPKEVPLTLARKKKDNHDKLEVSKCYQRALTIATKKYEDLYKLCRDGIIPNSYHLEYFSMNTSEEKADYLDETDTEESSTSSDDE